ncbi:hypothetical protein MPSEU_000865300 [Mayamaea pseudoterrestris]|nr:hypothetical protein MPSEU_000865300 [Mayamaea pseudoterrestris]
MSTRMNHAHLFVHAPVYAATLKRYDEIGRAPLGRRKPFKPLSCSPRCCESSQFPHKIPTPSCLLNLLVCLCFRYTGYYTSEKNVMDQLTSKALKKLPSDASSSAIRQHSLVSQLAFAAYGGLCSSGSMDETSDNNADNTICTKPCLALEDDDCTASSLAFSEESRSTSSSSMDGSDTSVASVENVVLDVDQHKRQEQEFALLKWTYLIVTFVVMLADGLQGTHLYVLYESYGYSVASLYCLGFLAGGLMSPVTGQIIDKFGRKKAAILYCCLEITINWLEQFPILAGLIASRMIGGFTTNLLSSVFETWLDTEFRRRGLPTEKYELIHRDSVIVSNIAAIASGGLSHALAVAYGPVGPFKGAVTSTAIALGVIALLWSENYGHQQGEAPRGMSGYFREAVEAYRRDSKMLRVGIIQSFSEGSVNVFIFLWSPALAALAKEALASSWGLDTYSEPAYGLIFGAFMAAGVMGGLVAPWLRRCMSNIFSPSNQSDNDMETVEVDGEVVTVRPMAVELLAAACYALSACLLALPCMFTEDSDKSFSVCLVAFLALEFLMGTFRPCEGVIRSLYFPAHARASIMSIPRIVVNLIVAVGVISTNFIKLRVVFGGIASLMLVSAALQLSMISWKEWDGLRKRVSHMLRLPLLRPATGTLYSHRAELIGCSEGVKIKSE